MTNKHAPIYVAGHTGLVGSAIVRVLKAAGFTNLLLRTHKELDLRDAAAVDEFFADHRPAQVYLAAGVAGGIHRNKTYPAQMIYDNLAIQTSVIEAARKHDAAKLLFIGSACAYPKICPQPIAPEAMLTGPVEPTNEPFAVAKIAGIRMCQAYNAQYGTRFICVIPSTIYGPNDHFDANGHVVAALIDRFHQAAAAKLPEVAVWGTGRPRREFMYADDFAAAAMFLMERYDASEIMNVGMGVDTSIADLAAAVAGAVGYRGQITFDTTKPDGMPQRLLDSSRLTALGWQPRVSLADGLARTYAWYLASM